VISPYKSSWFQVTHPAPSAKIRLFCFPYAGGSASVFHQWPDKFSRDVEIIALQYPGRGNRFGERLISTCDGIVSALMPHITPLLNKPYALFGHSNGGLVSFELARALQRAGHAGPVHHFISGKSPVQLPRKKMVLHHLPDEAFLRELSDLGGTPKEFIEDPELMRIFMPILRADFALSETYTYVEHGERLKTDATLLYGREDEAYSEGDVATWSELIDGHMDSVGYGAGHFFIHSHRQEVIRFVNQKLVSKMTEQEKSRLCYA
jgi:medium-chain acyl-[acyl-carrier-protein] hydrolase